MENVLDFIGPLVLTDALRTPGFTAAVQVVEEHPELLTITDDICAAFHLPAPMRGYVLRDGFADALATEIFRSHHPVLSPESAWARELEDHDAMMYELAYDTEQACIR